ncbi:MAG: hypothetical protein FJX76_12315 [Armatimonadetes bacterium]|nr:hypothetical protein [Armatimonadota bacterium]
MRNVSRILSIAAVVVLISGLLVPTRALADQPDAGIPSPSPSETLTPAASPTPSKPIKADKPAINVFRVTYDEPWSRPGWSIDIGAGPLGLAAGYARASGAVWFDNRTDNTLRDVKLLVRFWSARFHRNSGLVEYNVGKLGPREHMSYNYWAYVQSDERVTPYVEMLYKIEGSDQEYRALYNTQNVY